MIKTLEIEIKAHSEKEIAEELLIVMEKLMRGIKNELIKREGEAYTRFKLWED